MSFFSRKLSNDKRHKKEMFKKKTFFLKSWRDGYFSKRGKIIRKFDRDKHCWLQKAIL